MFADMLEQMASEAGIDNPTVCVRYAASIDWRMAQRVAEETGTKAGNGE